MNSILLEITKSYECDVLVIGGGVGGFPAAVNAARKGASVILAEKNGFLGGTATAGLIGTFMTCYDAKGNKRLIKGFYKEFVDKLVEVNGAVPPEKSLEVCKYGGYRTKGHFGVVSYDAEAFKSISEKMCIDSGVKLLYHMFLVGCDKNDSKVTKAYFATNNGIYEVSAKVFIDATGDAYLCDKAGLKSETGDENGERQSATMFFLIRGVDEKILDKHMENNDEMRARFFMDEIETARKRGEFPCGTPKLRIYKSPSDKWTVNMAQEDGLVDQFDVENITNAEISQRKQIEVLVDFLKKYIPACKNIELVQTAAEIGLREGRRVLGEYTLRKDDILSGTVFDDAICYCSNSIDIHKKDSVEYIPTKDDNIYTIPYRSLVVKGCDNVLVAGRCLSADREAMAAVRVMPPCFAMGEAAGVAAFLAVKHKVPVSAIPIKELKDILRDSGAIV